MEVINWNLGLQKVILQPPKQLIPMALCLINLFNNLTGAKRRNREQSEQASKIRKLVNSDICIFPDGDKTMIMKKDEEIKELNNKLEEMKVQIATNKTTIIISPDEYLVEELEKMKKEKEELKKLLRYIADDHKELITKIKACKKRDTKSGLRLDVNSIDISDYCDNTINL